jgi:hypothetical protein
MHFTTDYFKVCGEIEEKRNKIRVVNHGIRIREHKTSKYKAVAVITQQGSEIFTVTDYHPDEDVETYKITATK